MESIKKKKSERENTKIWVNVRHKKVPKFIAIKSFL